MCVNATSATRTAAGRASTSASAGTLTPARQMTGHPPCSYAPANACGHMPLTRADRTGPSPWRMVADGPSSPRASHGAVYCGSRGSSVYGIGGEPSACRGRGGSMSEYEFTISLRIRHPTIDPAAITRMLGMEPQHTWHSGAPRRGPAGEALDGVYRESY